MKHITITIGEDHSHESPNGASLIHPAFAMETSGNITYPEMAGILSLAYKKAVEMFLDAHPSTCMDCPAIQFHRSNMYRMDHLAKEIAGLNGQAS